MFEWKETRKLLLHPWSPNGVPAELQYVHNAVEREGCKGMIKGERKENSVCKAPEHGLMVIVTIRYGEPV